MYQQFRRWVQDGLLRGQGQQHALSHPGQRRSPGQPSAVILDARTLQSSCESGAAGYDGYKWRRKVHGRRHAGAVDRDDGHIRRRAGQAVRPGQRDRPVVKLNYPRRGRCLSCCPDAGWSSAVSGGFRAFDDSIVISSACLRGLASVPAKKFAEEGRHGRTPRQQHQ